jgi:SAM-dependent methyltransferase
VRTSSADPTSYDADSVGHSTALVQPGYAAAATFRPPDVLLLPKMATVTPVAEPQTSLHVALPVREFPAEPTFGQRYVFEGLGKSVGDHNHGLHKYPAKFIPQVPRWGLTHRPLPPKSVVLDPFCGSGTAVLEAALHGYTAIGVDVNPLAQRITQAKTLVIAQALSPATIASHLVTDARSRVGSLRAQLIPGEPSLGLHYTWANWFGAGEISSLLALRDAICARHGASSSLGRFLLVCLSSIAKACSVLDENQIKVRRVPDKLVADPFVAFTRVAIKTLTTQMAAGMHLEHAPRAASLVGSASALPLEDESVDRIITSPPYINAVDYTMTHKYNLCLLGLIDPDQFKSHCRDYIGMTERAVRSSDLAELPCAGHSSADQEVEALWLQGTTTARNRAFVVAQFFRGMSEAFAEMARVLRPGGLAVSVIGCTNRVCGRPVPTSTICEELAEASGLRLQLRFFHQIANVSSMRLRRSETGGIVPLEAVHVFVRA